MKTISQAQKIKSHQACMMRSITGIFGSSAFNYYRLQFDLGMEYIQMIEKEADKQESLAYSALFWAWWKNNWAIRDWEWIEWQLERYEVSETGVSDGDTPLSDLKHSYLSFHDIRDLIGEIRPPAAVYLKKEVVK